jgi:DNA modification methylase
MRMAGWEVHRTPLIWYNPDGFRCPWPDAGPQRKYELILYARRGSRGVTKIAGDVIEARKDGGLGHPAQKPVALLEELLRRSSRPGDRVLDPFAGSGSTLAACHSLKLACTALERDPAYYAMALQRLQGLSAQPELPL